MSERTLLVGYNLCDDKTQLAVYDAETKEPVVISTSGEDDPDGFIETAVELEDGTRYDDFLRKIRQGEELEVSTPVKVLAYFFRKTISLTRKKYPSETIKQLVITVPELTASFTQTLYDALELLNIGRDRAHVISHKQSFLYFSMYQQKDLWVNDVGMFDFSDTALLYTQMKTDRRKRPMLATASTVDYSEILELLGEDEEKNRTALENVIEGAIHKQILSALYMTGDRFKEEWTEPLLKKFCVGRRLFKGNNLYVSGACFAAKELAGDVQLSEYVLVDEGIVPYTIQIKVYADGKEEILPLSKAGVLWYQVDEEIEFIPDGDCFLPITACDMYTRQERLYEVPLEPVLGKTDRHCRLALRIRFADPQTCIVTIKDKGFGEIFPTSNRIWEHQLLLDSGEVR